MKESSRYFHVEQLRAAVYGLVVGDAVGVPFEFRERGSFCASDMVGHGTYDLPAGTYSDDSALTLATCDSIRACGEKVDVTDMRSRFKDWMFGGKIQTSRLTQ